MIQLVLLLRRILPVALALWCTGCRDHSHVLAVVLAIKGEVMQIEPEAKNLAPGAVIASPAAIRSVPDSAIVFAALPGVMIRLEDAGEIAIERLELHKRVDELISRTARLDLREGQILIWVEEFRHGSTELQIRTSAGELSVRGPVLAEVTSQANGGIRVICISDSLSAAGTVLSAGQWVTLLPGTSRPVAQFAADTNEVWQALLKAREIEPQLLDLLARQRERSPIKGVSPAAEAPKN